MNNSEQIMTRYLFGELSEAEASDFEQRYFTDPSVFKQLAQIESDLIDDYARGRLSPELRQRLERAYLPNPERRARLKFGQALVTKVDGEVSSVAIDQPAPESWLQKLFMPLFGKQRAFAFSLALVLLLVVFGSVWLSLRTRRLRNELAQTRATEAAREQRERELQQQLTNEQTRNDQLTAQLERERAQQSPETGVAKPKDTVPAFVSLLLVASDVRGGQTKSPTFSIPAGTHEVHIQLRTSENEYQSYQLELHAVGGASIFSNRNVKPGSSKSGATFTFSLPASKLTSREYILSLRGVTQSGDVEDVSKSLFRVERK